MVTRRRTAIQRTIRSQARACIIQTNTVLGDESTLLEKTADATYCVPKRTRGPNKNPRTRRKKKDEDDGIYMGPDPAEMERLMGAIDDAEDFELVFEKVKPETYVYNGKVKKGNVVDSTLNGSQLSDTTIKTATVEQSVIYSDWSSVGSRSMPFTSPSLENNELQDSLKSDRTLLPDEDNTTAFSNKENFVCDSSLTSRSPSTKKRRTLSVLEDDLLENRSIDDHLTSCEGSSRITESESTSDGYRTPPEDIPDDPAIDELIERTATRQDYVPDPSEIQKTASLYDADDRISDVVGEVSSGVLEKNTSAETILHSDRTKSDISMALNEDVDESGNNVICNTEQTISKSSDTTCTRRIARSLRSKTKTESSLSMTREDCDFATGRTYDSVEISSRLSDVADILNSKSSSCTGKRSDGSQHSTEVVGSIHSTLTQQIQDAECVATKETLSLEKSKATGRSTRENSSPTASSTQIESSASQKSVVCSSPCLNSTQASTSAILQLDQSPILSQSPNNCDPSYQRSLSTCRTLSGTMLERMNASRNEMSTKSKSRLSLFVKSCSRHSQSRFWKSKTIEKDNNISIEIQGTSTPARIPDSTIHSIRPDASTILRGKQSVLSIRSEADFYLDGYLGDKDDFVSQLMFICKQSGFLEFDDYIKRFNGPSKLGEGTFGEVFQATLDGKTVALKIIPFVRSDDDIIELNGDYTKPAENVLPELLISKELSDLSENSCNQTSGFVKVHDAKVVRGNWPKSLLKCWNDFKKKFPRKCLNTFPGEYMDPEKVYYLLIALGHGGSDLESVAEQKRLKSKEQVVSVLVQVCLTLVIAESSLEFEHRDLHWGNVLVKISDDTEEVVTYVYEGEAIQLRTYGYRSDHTTIYLNLGADKELFEGKGEGHKGGDYQFDIYRMMKDSNGDEWSHFNPKSNCFWIHYLAKKVINAIPRYPKTRKMELLSIFDKVLEVDSLNDFILLPEVDKLFKDYIVDE
ncbi:unnamed protein product [Bursaphelenchus xylophilus]|uniref:non-specific serine/threonine protein kinase n=1 Tax=Bursaphelenchus xylophilus TaxID=6326 RepID=A0A7I8WW12_BURXY|nr:unnamed protein product [Bursaphelenchus xylophilus]CAG9098263.1 unnamed protein product [Bursaphelenchus xylophilus]